MLADGVLVAPAVAAFPLLKKENARLLAVKCHVAHNSGWRLLSGRREVC